MGSPVCLSQGLALAAVPVISTPPSMSAHVAASATLAEIPEALCAPCKFESLAPVLPAVACHFSQAAVPLRVPPARGLSRMQPALRVNAARCARRCLRMYSRTQGVAPPGRTRAIRRAVGARLLPTCDAPTMQAAFDSSRLRAQLQAGLQVMGHHGSSGQLRSLKAASSGPVDQLLEPYTGHLSNSDQDQNTLS